LEGRSDEEFYEWHTKIDAAGGYGFDLRVAACGMRRAHRGDPRSGHSRAPREYMGVAADGGPRDEQRRPVMSRDMISRRETIARDPNGSNDAVRERVRIAIEQTLSSKGLRQVSDPRDADFLVEYHLAVRKRDVTLQHVYPSSYPGVVCGPYGCWESWGWGPPVVGYENIRYREGTIVFDLVKQSSRQLAYRAVGQKPVNRHTSVKTRLPSSSITYWAN